MAKDRLSDHKEKKDKKEKKHKRSEENGIKKHKKEKHERVHRHTATGEPEVTTTETREVTTNGDASDSGAEAVEQTVVLKEAVPSNTEPEIKTVKVTKDKKSNGAHEIGVYNEASFVPFAHPLADEKALKKVLKGVKRGK